MSAIRKRLLLLCLQFGNTGTYITHAGRLVYTDLFPIHAHLRANSRQTLHRCNCLSDLSWNPKTIFSFPFPVPRKGAPEKDLISEFHEPRAVYGRNIKKLHSIHCIILKRGIIFTTISPIIQDLKLFWISFCFPCELKYFNHFIDQSNILGWVLMFFVYIV